MNDFLRESAGVFKNIHRLQEIIAQTEKYTLLKQNSVFDKSQENVVENKIEQLDQRFDTISGIIKEDIKKTKTETDLLAKHKARKCEVDLRKLHILKQTKDLTEAIGNYRSLKYECKAKENELLKRALQISNSKADEITINKIAESNQLSDSKPPFALGSKSANEMLEHSQQRKDRIEKIVITIQKLANMIDEINNLVYDNSKVIDGILINVSDSEMHLAQSNVELESALAYQRKANFIKRIIFSIFLVFLAITIFYLYFVIFLRPRYYYY